MPFKTFTSTTLSSSDMNTYLMQQANIVCTSGTHPASPTTGMVIYETDTNTWLYWNGSAWVPALYYEEWTFATLVTVSGTNYSGADRKTSNKLIGSSAWSAGNWTAPSSGVYMINLTLPTLTPGATSTFGRILIGGANAGSSGAAIGGITNHANNTISVIRWLASGTVVTLLILQNTGGNLTLNTQDIIAIARVA